MWSVLSCTLLLVAAVSADPLSPCYQRGINFPGADMQDLHVASKEACAQLCLDKAGCKSFTYRINDRNCWLKSKVEGNGRTGLFAGGFISATISCFNGVIPCPHGQTKKSGTCVAITCPHGQQLLGDNCLTAAEKACYKSNTNFPGNDLQNIGDVVDAGACVGLCKARAGCRSITYRVHDKQCWLKSTDTGSRVKSDGGDDLISLTMSCLDPIYCFEQNINFPGADIVQDHQVASKEACAQLCLGREGCRSFTYRVSDKNCWLKNKDQGNGRTGLFAGGLFSATMSCFNGVIPCPHGQTMKSGACVCPQGQQILGELCLTATEKACYKANTDFPGHDLQNIGDVVDARACRGLCKARAGCRSITYRVHDHQCWLKSTDTGSRVKLDGAEGLISLTMSCLEPAYCFEKNINFPGADMQDLQVESKEACARLCQGTTGCKSITYRVSDKNCWLKNKDEGNARTGLFAGGLFSATMSCFPGSLACPVGQKAQAGVCVAVTCPKGQKLEGSDCKPITCPTGKQLSGNNCVDITCPTGKKLVGSDCVQITCPTGQKLNGDKCEAITCPKGQKLNGNKCEAITCPKGQELVGNKCQAVDQCKGNPCGENEKCLSKTGSYQCVCQDGFILKKKQCVAQKKGSVTVTIKNKGSFRGTIKAGKKGFSIVCALKLQNMQLADKTSPKNVTWLKDGKPVSSKTAQASKQKVGQLYKLTFKKPSAADSGEYTCLFNQQGVEGSADVTVTVK